MHLSVLSKLFNFLIKIVLVALAVNFKLFAADIESLPLAQMGLVEAIEYLDVKYASEENYYSEQTYVVLTISLLYQPDFVATQPTIGQTKASIKQLSEAKVRDLLFKYIHKNEAPQEVRVEAWKSQFYDSFKPINSKISRKRNSKPLFTHQYSLVLPLRATAENPSFWHELVGGESFVQSFEIEITNVINADYLNDLRYMWREEPSIKRKTGLMILNHPNRFGVNYRSTNLLDRLDTERFKKQTFSELRPISIDNLSNETADSGLTVSEALMLYSAAESIRNSSAIAAGGANSLNNPEAIECSEVVPFEE